MTIHRHLTSFSRNKIFKKKPGEIVIKQIIEFELRAPGPPGRTCNHKTGYFHDKTKISKKNKSSSELLLTARCTILQKAMYLASPSPEPSQLQNLSKK